MVIEFFVCCNKVGRDSAVGIATRYGLDGPGIESLQGRDFAHPSRPVLGPTQPPIQWVPGLSQGWSGRGVALITHPYILPGLTLNPLTWKIWGAPSNASRWQMGFNSRFKGLNNYKKLYLGVFAFCTCFILICLACIVSSFKLSCV